MILQVILFILSIVVLYYGAEFALDGAERIGLYFKLSPLVIGLVIIGFGTSLPEFFVSQLACFNGESSIALGNIIGSNIANLFLILGLVGVIIPFALEGKDLRNQTLYHLLLCFLLIPTFMSDSIKPFASVMLGCFFVSFMYYTFKELKKMQGEDREGELDVEAEFNLKIVAKLLLGFVLLYAGGELLVHSGTKLGELAGISTFIISAIFLAFGTSFPELMTALIACKNKKDMNFITGNILGSNIFNVAFVLTSLAPYKIMIDRSFINEIGLLLFGGLMMVFLSFRGKAFSRLVGVIFLGCYLVMVGYWIQS